MAHSAQFAANNVDWGALARGVVDVCVVGRTARHVLNYRAGMAKKTGRAMDIASEWFRRRTVDLRDLSGGGADLDSVSGAGLVSAVAGSERAVPLGCSHAAGVDGGAGLAGGDSSDSTVAFCVAGLFAGSGV